MTETTRNLLPLPLPAAELLPHRPPMLLIDRLTARDDGRATAFATVTASSLCMDPARGILPECLIELMAQTMAASNGYDALCDARKPRNGYLVGLDNFRLLGTATPGEMLRIETTKTYEFGPVRVIEGRVFCAERMIAIGEVKVWEDPEDADRP